MRNFDYGPYAKRGQMAKDALRELAEDAKQLAQALDANDTLPAGVEFYISTAGDRMHSVSRYMLNRIAEFKPSAASYGATEPESDSFIVRNWKPLAVGAAVLLYLRSKR
jgi:hypothetical protein